MDINTTIVDGMIKALPQGQVEGGLHQCVTTFLRAAAFSRIHEGETPLDVVRDTVANAETDRFGHRVSLAEHPDGTWTARWDGIFTPGRWVQVDVHGDKAVLTWDTGTGEPSGHIGSSLEDSTLARFSAADLDKESENFTPEGVEQLAQWAI